MNAQHPDELQQLKMAADAVQSLREFLALDEELDVRVAREALVQIEQAVIAEGIARRPGGRWPSCRRFMRRNAWARRTPSNRLIGRC
jgi:hypothetical protein